MNGGLWLIIGVATVLCLIVYIISGLRFFLFWAACNVGIGLIFSLLVWAFDSYFERER